MCPCRLATGAEVAVVGYVCLVVTSEMDGESLVLNVHHALLRGDETICHAIVEGSKLHAVVAEVEGHHVAVVFYFRKLQRHDRTYGVVDDRAFHALEFGVGAECLAVYLHGKRAVSE